ncbi:replication endonuclease [Aliarcobacter cryaerophilus]|uniref:replication endonuclease n=1 Tax=Aliarcobacter TaxID=2321111 RepID=UPI0021B4817C|nr:MULTISPECIES: replication endonuclease [Aliarcobacter]MCT7444442.1 replication endonuclease [Aliarcobacter cryaerophilus]MCT7468311.1 replication endonuclease [Aliarcobacter cryaerophilus]MCT7470335.1 replication endonuclease [Aliarcobacter cryaerophilus]MCT7479118.1 replication endonuclease [Aliarcobacter cryaerophilus]MCT7644804.1 replication endonuclease [Aliarcobacter butzleri]
MKGYYSKKLQKNSKLYQELQDNIKLYINHSIHKESKQKSYLQHTAFLNPKTGEYLNIDYDFEKKYKEYSRISEQRALTIQELAKRKEFCSVFITLTLPSHFHPFKSIATKQGRLYVEENKDFAFSSIQEAVTNGYQELNNIYQTFYKRVKNYTKDDLYYVKAIENHQTTIPHLHLVLYFPLEKFDFVKGVFKRVVEHFELDRIDFEEVSFKENINYASKYLLKYIIKDLNNSSDILKARILDGWKRYHKIRVLTTSQLPLNVMVYKKIYKSVSFTEKNKINFRIDDKMIITLKEKIDIKCKELGVPIYLYFQDNFSIEKTILKSSGRKIIRLGARNSLFRVKLVNEKNAKYYKIKDFKVSYKNREIYAKQEFIKITM